MKIGAITIGQSPRDDVTCDINDLPGADTELLQAATLIRDTGAGIVVLDCIGYTAAMKKSVERISKKSVVLSRTLLARAVGELTTSF